MKSQLRDNPCLHFDEHYYFTHICILRELWLTQFYRSGLYDTSCICLVISFPLTLPWLREIFLSRYYVFEDYGQLFWPLLILETPWVRNRCHPPCQGLWKSVTLRRMSHNKFCSAEKMTCLFLYRSGNCNDQYKM